jgi:hypothetical protein
MGPRLSGLAKHEEETAELQVPRGDPVSIDRLRDSGWVVVLFEDLQSYLQVLVQGPRQIPADIVSLPPDRYQATIDVRNVVPAGNPEPQVVVFRPWIGFIEVADDLQAAPPDCRGGRSDEGLGVKLPVKVAHEELLAKGKRFRCFSADDGSSAYQGHFGIKAQYPHLSLQELGPPYIIGIEKSDDVAEGMANPNIPCRRRAGVFLEKVTNPGSAFYHGPCAIGGSVINNQDLKIAVSLGKHRLESPLDNAAPVISGDNHAYVGCAHLELRVQNGLKFSSLPPITIVKHPRTVLHHVIE